MRRSERIVEVPMSTGPSLDTRALDRARISRDPRFDGKFFIAVTSTRIYCRPICSVRNAKRTNIRYYFSAAAAAEAGYRPCLRCRPEAAPGTAAWQGTSAVVKRALRLIDEGILDGNSVHDLAGKLGVGPRHLDRLFVQHLGATPIVLAQTRRLHFAKRLLDETVCPSARLRWPPALEACAVSTACFGKRTSAPHVTCDDTHAPTLEFILRARWP